jgi:hypothetical protein
VHDIADGVCRPVSVSKVRPSTQVEPTRLLGLSMDSELDTQLVVNRRGDALVVWRAKGRVAQLWARYKPAGHEWMKPVKVTPTDSPPRAYFGAGLGDRGHAAVAWTTRNNHQIQVRRLTPTP